MRNTQVDVLRGMLILYIVCVTHGVFWLEFPFQLLASGFLFEMPAIFMISGYSHYLWECKSKQSGASQTPLRRYFTFLVSRVLKILIPYFVYAGTCALIVVAEGVQHEQNEVINLIQAWLNPFVYGRGFTVSTLNWHLWFIPIFLLVTAIFPLIRGMAVGTDLSVWFMTLVFLSLQIVLQGLNFPAEGLVKQTLFYLMFTLAGYRLAKLGGDIPETYLIAAALGSVVQIVLIFAYTQNLDLINMQRNKFPPNYLFFIFSVFWMSMFLLLGKRCHSLTRKLEQLGGSLYTRPFLSAGYSIYLWQGLAYTISIRLGNQIEAPKITVLAFSLMLSLTFGIAFSFAERIRLP